MSMHRLFLCFIVLLMPSMALAGPDRLSITADGIVIDNKGHLMWQLDKSPRRFSSADNAARYIKQLDLGDHHDW